MKQSHLVLAALGLSALAGSAHAYSFQLDTFAVWKNADFSQIHSPADLLNTLPIFYDSFADGAAPPLAPNFTAGGPASYAVFGSVGPEGVVNGQGILTLDSSGTLPNDFGTPVQQAILNTNTDPNSLAGLKQGSSNFAVGGIFNLINPGNANGAYGVRFTDIGLGNGNDIVSLAVRGRVDGKAVVNFSHYDNTTGISTLISSAVLDTTHQQIGLGLAYMDPDGNGPEAKAVYAAYFYLDNDVPSAFYDMAGSASLFNGENFTRAAFYAADVSPVPEPAEYALLMAGLGLLGWRTRRERGSQEARRAAPGVS